LLGFAVRSLGFAVRSLGFAVRLLGFAVRSLGFDFVRVPLTVVHPVAFFSGATLGIFGPSSDARRTLSSDLVGVR
jgi:ascorbate-specific PTS system EIIC-type component UlaA